MWKQDVILCTFQCHVWCQCRIGRLPSSWMGIWTVFTHLLSQTKVPWILLCVSPYHMSHIFLQYLAKIGIGIWWRPWILRFTRSKPNGFPKYVGVLMSIHTHSVWVSFSPFLWQHLVLSDVFNICQADESVIYMRSSFAFSLLPMRLNIFS